MRFLRRLLKWSWRVFVNNLLRNGVRMMSLAIVVRQRWSFLKDSARISAVGRLRQRHHDSEARLDSYWEFDFKKKRLKSENNHHVIGQSLNIKHKSFLFRAGEMTCQLRVSNVLAEDLNSATSDLLSQLTTFYTSSSKGFNTSGLQRGLNPCSHVPPPHTYM